MGSHVQSKRPSKKRIVEENYSRGKIVPDIDLNNIPDEISEIPHVTLGPSNPATSLHSHSIVLVGAVHEHAIAPIYVDDNDDEVVFLSESNQVNRNEREVNRSGMTGGGNRSIDVIHIESDTHSISSGTAIEEPVTILTLSNSNVGRIMPGSHVFNSDSYEDVESNRHPKRMKVGSSREPQMEIYLEPEEPEQPSFKCVVCLGPLVDETSTICGHIFCQSCIKNAIKAQKKCPTCRRKLNMRNIHRVYFPGSS